MDLFAQCGGLNVVLFAKPIELGLSERAVNASRMLGAEWIGDLVQTTEAELFRLPNTGRKTIYEIRHVLARYGLRLGMHLPEWDGVDPEAERDSIPGGIRCVLSQLESEPGLEVAATLQEEARNIVSKVCEGRNRDLVLSLWGVDGTPRKTLEEVGQAYGMTRERVRQIEAKVIRTLGARWHKMPLLDRAVGLLRTQSPLDATDLAPFLVQNDVAARHISGAAFLQMCKVFERKPDLIVSQALPKPLLGSLETIKVLREALLIARRETSRYGCTSTTRIQFQLTGRVDFNAELTSALQLFDEIIWLDTRKTWLISRRSTHNSLYTLLEKVFSVTQSVHLTELRQAVSRPHRVTYVPPAEVLANLCEYFDFVRTSENLIQSQKLLSAEFGFLDSIFVDAFHKIGSPATREELEDYCVGESNMNPASFYQYLSYSPLFLKLARGVFSLVGAHVSTGSVEAAKERIRQDRISPQHGWTPDGRLWVVLRLSRPSVASGAFFVPSFVQEHAEGLWTTTLADGTPIGTMEVKQGIANGLRDEFVLLAADAGDFCLLKFDLAKKLVSVQLGGTDLEDQAGREEGSEPDIDAGDFQESAVEDEV